MQGKCFTSFKYEAISFSTGADYECRCPPGFSGNARVSCDDNPCTRDQSPCAPNARCQARGNQAICTCP